VKSDELLWENYFYSQKNGVLKDCVTCYQQHFLKSYDLKIIELQS